jgi:hypothetical protein
MSKRFLLSSVATCKCKASEAPSVFLSVPATARDRSSDKMAGEGALAVGSDVGGGGAITFTVVVSCLTAASGGLLLGYDISVTG